MSKMKINWGWIFPCTQYVTLQYQQLKPEIEWLKQENEIDWLIDQCFTTQITERAKLEVAYVHVWYSKACLIQHAMGEKCCVGIDRVSNYTVQ